MIITNTLLTGTIDSFLFTIYPSMGIYTPTGYNENFMYIQQSAQTLPNGIVHSYNMYI